MNTLAKLNKHLATEIKEYRKGAFHKETAEPVVCADGTTLSVQASKTHYCSPQENTGPYWEVEVWLVTCEVTEFEYDDSEPSAYVPIGKVVELINNHGGFKNAKAPATCSCGCTTPVNEWTDQGRGWPECPDCGMI